MVLDPFGIDWTMAQHHTSAHKKQKSFMQFIALRLRIARADIVNRIEARYVDDAVVGVALLC